MEKYLRPLVVLDWELVFPKLNVPPNDMFNGSTDF